MNIIFAGTPEFAVPSLRMLLASPYRVSAVYTQPDRPAGRGQRLQPSPVKTTALAAKVPVFQPESLAGDEAQQQLRDLQADLMVVVAYGMILPQALLDIPRLGCINVHASLLPRWRGAAPIQRAVLAGDPETGVTIMKIVRKLDAGDMLHKEICPISDSDTSASLFEKLAELGAQGLANVLPQLDQGTAVGIAQDESQVTYAKKLEKHEAHLDWRDTAANLARQVRGLNPWPVAQTLYNGQTLKVWRAEALPTSCELPPGSLRHHDGKHLDVATAKGWLRLLEVQLPGSKRIPAAAFANAHACDGLRLGAANLEDAS